jgi:hypothetical protein
MQLTPACHPLLNTGWPSTSSATATVPTAAGRRWRQRLRRGRRRRQPRQWRQVGAQRLALATPPGRLGLRYHVEGHCVLFPPSPRLTRPSKTHALISIAATARVRSALLTPRTFYTPPTTSSHPPTTSSPPQPVRHTHAPRRPRRQGSTCCAASTACLLSCRRCRGSRRAAAEWWCHCRRSHCARGCVKRSTLTLHR